MKKSILFYVLFLMIIGFGCTPKSRKYSKIRLSIRWQCFAFSEPASASVARKNTYDSKHQWRTAESHLPKDAPNIVIFMTDDAGFGNPGLLVDQFIRQL